MVKGVKNSLKILKKINYILKIKKVNLDLSLYLLIINLVIIKKNQIIGYLLYLKNILKTLK